MPNDQINSQPLNSSTPKPTNRFAWGTFIAGCLVGSVVLPIIFGSIALALLGTALSTGAIFSGLPGPFMMLRNLSPFSSLSPSTSSSSPSSLLPPTALPLTATNCGTDPACMQNALLTCSPAESQINSEQFNLVFKVLGPSQKITGNCQVSLEIASINNDSLKLLGLDNQSMICDVKPSAVTDPSDILSAPDSDISCDGTLWGLLKIVRAGQSSK